MTPSNEQINDWLKAAEASPEPRFLIFATLAAEWGAKQEREALKKYGRHLDDCALTLGGYQCTCGFNQQEVPR